MRIFSNLQHFMCCAKVGTIKGALFGPWHRLCMWRLSYLRGAQRQICPATGSITAAREPRGRILLRVIYVWMIPSVYHLPPRVAFQRDIPSPWRDCWSANGDQINVCVIHSHMGALLHVLEDGERENRSGPDSESQNGGWIKTGKLGGFEKPERFKRSLACAGHSSGCGGDWFGSAPSPKPRWCKRSRVLSKWSPADCWPLCLFPSIVLRVGERGCARVRVGSWGVPVCMPPGALGRARAGEGTLKDLPVLPRCMSEQSVQLIFARPWLQSSPWWQESSGTLSHLTLFWHWDVLTPTIRLYFPPAAA